MPGQPKETENLAIESRPLLETDFWERPTLNSLVHFVQVVDAAHHASKEEPAKPKDPAVTEPVLFQPKEPEPITPS
ncbi:hypothetical protein A2W24_04240 [Microgenomates group bacterium RBG_16_45_19]|nr:MAG: hypothetical protein A2W24_04240 [Microgenomates group bacterium RBG_16_45_19]